MAFVRVPAGTFWMGGVPPIEALKKTYTEEELALTARVLNALLDETQKEETL